MTSHVESAHHPRMSSGPTPSGTRAGQIYLRHSVPREDIAFGVVYARGVEADSPPEELGHALAELVQQRATSELEAQAEARRLASREMLRMPRYKPTGRSKPASEYLLRVARGGDFPSISGPVDINNYLSLRYMVPISLWDLARAESCRFELRWGRENESYVFNSAGQELALSDLVCGCALDDASSASRPIVTPVKDSLATKLDSDSRDLAGLVYYPLAAGSTRELGHITEEFAAWLGRCGSSVNVRLGVLEPEGTVVL